MDVKTEVQGLRELEDALSEFAPRLVKKAFKQAMNAAAIPQITAAKEKAPVLKEPTKHRQGGELRDSIGVNITVGKRGVRARVGPTRSKGESNQSPGTYGLMVEFGSIHGPAQPYLRPAFDQTKNDSVTQFAAVLRAAIETMKR